MPPFLHPTSNATTPLTTYHRELFSSSRHHLGIYHCVAVTARYHLPPALAPAATAQDTETSLLTAVASVVQDQPALRVGILHEGNCKATTFSHVVRVDLRNHVEWRPSAGTSRDEYEAELASTQAWLHDQRWPDIETRPPWRIIVLRPAHGLFPEPHLDITFAYHHSLMDGTAGKEFHEHLLTALRTTTTATTPNPVFELSFPEPPELPSSQEDAICFKNSYTFLARTVWDMIRPASLLPKSPSKTPWTSRPITLSAPYKTRVRPIDLDASALASLLRASRDHETTLTGTLHALILTSLARRLPPSEAGSFASSTPISLRPWLTDAPTRQPLRVLITAHTTAHPPAIVSGLRAAQPSDEAVWQNARRVKADITKRTSRLPADDVAGLLPLIPDLASFWRSKDGKPRDAAWEVSNLGVLRQGGSSSGGDGEQGGDRAWRISRAFFTNGAMIAGPAIGFNAISVEGAGLTVTVTWQEGDVPEDLVEGVRSDVLAFAERWHSTGSFFPPSSPE